MYTAEMDKLLTHPTAWINLTDTLLNEKSQTQKA